jgi:hypothetical protein
MATSTFGIALITSNMILFHFKNKGTKQFVKGDNNSVLNTFFWVKTTSTIFYIQSVAMFCLTTTFYEGAGTPWMVITLENLLVPFDR